MGNPANTNALIALKCATGLPPENFTALTRLDQNRAKAQIARKLHTSASSVHTVVIWGNLNVTYLCIPLIESQMLINTTHHTQAIILLLNSQMWHMDGWTQRARKYPLGRRYQMISGSLKSSFPVCSNAALL